MFRVVDGVMDNMDRKMVEIHGRKIECAKEVCPSLYEGFAPLGEEGFDSIEVPSLTASVLPSAPAFTAYSAASSASAASADEDPTGDDPSPVGYGGVDDVD
jgi:hypothetical protein